MDRDGAGAGRLAPGTARPGARWPRRRRRASAVRCSSALRAAHAAGIQHRDVKPANVLLRPDGTAVLTDFGIAALQGSTSLTATGELVGSPEYMAPERVRGRDDDPASDLWSLGLVLYVCVEGVSPLRRATTLRHPGRGPRRPGTAAGPLGSAGAGASGPARTGPGSAARRGAAGRDAGAGGVGHDAGLGAADGTAAGRLPRRSRMPGRAARARPTYRAVRWPAGRADRLPQHATSPQPPGRRRNRTPASLVAVIAVAARGHRRDRRSSSRCAARATGRAAPGSAARRRRIGRDGNESGHHAEATQPSPDGTPTPGTRAADRLRPAGSPSSSPSRSPPAPPSGTNGSRRSGKSIPEAVFVRSDDYASLRPGFWVIYAPGPFTDGRAALNFCAERGRTSPNTASAAI